MKLTCTMVRQYFMSTFLLCCMLPLFSAAAAAAETVPVFVSILPQKYFVEKIGGDRVAVSVMVAPGATPAAYEPKPRQMVALTRSRLYFAVGVPFETVWLPKIAATNADLRIVRTDTGIQKRPMASAHASHAHSSGLKDPHIWLSPVLVKTQARTIYEALVEENPENRSFYQKKFGNFIQEIDALDAEIRSLLAGHAGAAFMVFHPSWGYFADTYGLRQIPIEIEGKHPKPAQLQSVIADAREQAIGIIFVQPQFSSQSARTVAGAIGARLVQADPLALDWADNLRRHAAIIAREAR